MKAQTLPRIRTTRAKQINTSPVSLVGSLALGIVAIVLSPLLLLNKTTRNRFDGDNMGGNDGDLTPYDQQTRAEREKAGAWDVDLRGDE